MLPHVLSNNKGVTTVYGKLATYFLISSCLVNNTVFFEHLDLGFVCTVLLNIGLEKM